MPHRLTVPPGVPPALQTLQGAREFLALGAAAPESQSSPWVLVVEDDEAIAELLGLWFSSVGVNAVVATSVRESLDLLELLTLYGSEFRGLLTDYRLPDGTGCRVIREFRDVLPGRPMAVITAYHDLTLAVWLRTQRIPLFMKPLVRPRFMQWVQNLGGHA
jgi:CheY-like chemotaxis protein